MKEESNTGKKHPSAPNTTWLLVRHSIMRAGTTARQNIAEAKRTRMNNSIFRIQSSVPKSSELSERRLYASFRWSSTGKRFAALTGLLLLYRAAQFSVSPGNECSMTTSLCRGADVVLLSMSMYSLS